MSRVSVMCVVIVVALSSSVWAEVQINVRESSSQTNPAIAADTRGGAVVVWSSYYSTAGRSNDILARRLDGAGVPAGEEFVVNAISEGNQTEPAVAVDDRSRFAVVWQGPGPEEDVFLRLYDPQGVPVTGDLLANLDAPGRQLYPCVAAGGGAFVVAWESQETTAYGEQAFLYAHLFDPNGAGLGGDILIDPGIYDCRYPDIATDAAGDFVVTWMRDRSSHPIMARLYDPNGVPRTEPFAVNTTSVASVTRPSVAMTSLGHFVVAWDGDPNRAGDDDIYARLYDPNGAPRGEPFLVNAIRAGAQQWPQAAVNDANEFIIVWECDAGDPNVATDVFARRFDVNGLPTGEEVRLNAHTLDEQRDADVVMAADGSFLAVWESDGQDGSGLGVFAHAQPRVDPNEPPAD